MEAKHEAAIFLDLALSGFSTLPAVQCRAERLWRKPDVRGVANSVGGDERRAPSALATLQRMMIIG